MDSKEALSILTAFQALTKNKPCNQIEKVSTFVGSNSFRVNFRAGNYHVLIQISIGPRGGVSENNIVVDIRQKVVQVDKLVFAYAGLRPDPTFGNGDRSLLVYEIGSTRGLSKEEVETRVMDKLTKLIEIVDLNPNEISQRIMHIADLPTLTSQRTVQFTMSRV